MLLCWEQRSNGSHVGCTKGGGPLVLTRRGAALRKLTGSDQITPSENGYPSTMFRGSQGEVTRWVV